MTMTFIEKFEENVRRYPDKVVLQDEHEALSLQTIYALSGRVYAYLKNHGIGKEQFVLIHLPYSVSAYVCLLGVWRAGAAAVLADIQTSKERVSFIYDDCRCTFTIDSCVWNEILATEPLEGHEDTDPHDAAFAVYTSGSEGTPKGIIHEYGKLEFTASNLNDVIINMLGDMNPVDHTQYCYVPLATIGAIGVILMSLWTPLAADIGSVALMKDPKRLVKYIEEKNIAIVFLPPSYYIYNKIESQTIKVVYMSSEPLRNFYRTGLTLVNMYVQSEGCHICGFMLNHSYHNTPIGKPLENGIEMKLYDDDGQPVAGGMSGELCYKNPYFRGYINDEERTRLSFVGEYFRSGDIARINEDGNYVILGRKTDMIKINGNRIEPAEIEAAVKRVLGIDWAFAKGFVQADRSFICVYYTAEVEIDLAETREQLMKILPNYMIPSYFIHIDDVPRLPNGKVNRQAFKAPDVEEYRAPYAAPDNEVEERLCTLMQQILGIDRIGTDDDFFLLGGDSLRAIRLATECNIQGISVTDIYTARTPRAIAERWMTKQME